MKILLLISAVLAVTLAKDGCSSLQAVKVKDQWFKAFGKGPQRRDMGKAIWKSILAQIPEAKSILTRVNVDDIGSGEFIAHGARVFGGLDIAISFLDDKPTLRSAMNHLHAQHQERGIPNRYFDVFENTLMKLIPASLGRCFDQEAWENCFGVIKDGIKYGIE